MPLDEFSDSRSVFVLDREHRLLHESRRLASNHHPVLSEEVQHRIAGDAELLGQRLGGLAGGIPTRDFCAGLCTKAPWNCVGAVLRRGGNIGPSAGLRNPRPLLRGGIVTAVRIL
ncbi:hypothetical protein [Microbacterium paulum]